MAVKYNLSNGNTRLDENNFIQITGYSLKQIYSFMGLNVIKEEKTLTYLGGSYPELEIKVTIHALNCTIERLLNFEDATIFNQQFRIANKNYKGRRIGIKVFCSQVYAAQTAGFKNLSVWAVGNAQMFHEWNGYITWGKFGFTMDQDYQIKFELLMQELGLPFSTLNDLLQKNEKVWKENGWGWTGTFDLNKQSHNYQLLKEYLKSRNLDESGY